MGSNKAFDAALRAAIYTLDIPADIVKLIEAARTDLNYGPLSHEDAPGYPGFESAVRAIGAWFADNVHDVFVDEDSGCVSTREPEGSYIDENGDDCDSEAATATWQDAEPYYLVTQRDIARHVMGELAEYF